ncbi:MAG: NAD(P)H-hydrate dehydratase [Turneriella sp.]|nr:NAD(P)H-hydrate dehydratase [Turneriella sp.]
MHLILNRTQIREYDRLATALCKVPSLILMENAGRGAAEFIAQRGARQSAKPKVAIVCGTGNNGGDGFVVARHLAAHDEAEIAVFLVGDAQKISGDAKVNLEAMLASGILYTSPDAEAIRGADIVVDALFGTGLDRAVTGDAAAAIAAMNAAEGIRIALDIPSGLDADTGAVLGVAVKAAHTVTFAYAKPGLYTPEGRNHAGDIHVVKLGVPDKKILATTGHAAALIARETIAANLALREAKTYKHKAGDILIVAGSAGKTGAAKLTAEAALKTGAGLATVCTWSDALPAFEKETKEIMLTDLRREAIAASLGAAVAKRSAVVIGPGFGLDNDAKTAVDFVLGAVDIPLIIDADALTLAAAMPEALRNARAKKILTPHAGELARLLGVTAAAIEADRYQAVARAAALTQAIVVLKGAHTLVAAPDGEILVSAEANPVLATAGSGDVLAGIIAAFTAQMTPFEAAAAGVYVHAAAGNLWQKHTRSDRGMLAGAIAALVPEVLGNLLSI